MTWTVSVLTIYPEMFPGPLAVSLAGRALDAGIWALDAVDIRDFARDKHRTVDETPAGGGPGMVMRVDVLARAIDAACGDGADGRPLIYLTPRGMPMTQALLRGWAQEPGIVVVCGRFEGVDERIFAARPGIEVSLGDFVLSGGEIAAMTLIDGVVRLLPGVVGSALSVADESFEQCLLEYPQYTRPRDFEDRDIPAVLLSGDHQAIARFRREEAERITKERRPDLWARYQERRKKSEIVS
jgi:tRNA (guanine37-N1)-methyltransferase